MVREIEIAIPPDAKLDNAETIIETACAAAGLRLTLKGTLKQYSGCVHWHYKRGKEPGTLEITLWTANRRIWFKVSAGREREWIDGAIENVLKRLEKNIRDSQL